MANMGTLSFRTCFRSVRFPASYFVQLATAHYNSGSEPAFLINAYHSWLLIEILSSIGNHSMVWFFHSCCLVYLYPVQLMTQINTCHPIPSSFQLHIPAMWSFCQSTHSLQLHTLILWLILIMRLNLLLDRSYDRTSISGCGVWVWGRSWCTDSYLTELIFSLVVYILSGTEKGWRMGARRC
jgi:hypothetical protein